MALPPGDGDARIQAAAPADFHGIAKLCLAGGLADNAEIRDLALGSAPFQHFHRAVGGIAFLIAGDQQRKMPVLLSRPPRQRPRSRLSYRRRRGHIACRPRRCRRTDRSAIPRPGGTTSVWPAKHRSGTWPRPLGVKILDLAEAQPGYRKAQPFQLARQHRLRAPIRRGYRAAAHQGLREGERSSCPEQIVDRGFAAGLRIDALDDHGAGQARPRRAIRQVAPGSVPGTTTE